MARVLAVSVEGYRSIADEITVRLPDRGHVVLLGENNAGKSNIIRGIELVLGERWPGNHAAEDHEFFGRNPTGHSNIKVSLHLSGCESWAGRVDTVELLVSGEGPSKNSFLAYTDAGREHRVSNEIRGQCAAFVVGADRSLSYQLSYGSQFTLLSKLMRRFHKTLMSDPARRSKLEEHFQELRKIFGGVAEFDEFARTLQNEVSYLSQNMQYGLDVDFSAYDPSNFFRALRVHAKREDEHISLDELGTGQEQVLALAFAYSYAKAFGSADSGLMLLLEEPETNLHPLAQRWLAKQLTRFTDAGIQLVITTHNPAFVDLRNLEGLVIVRKDSPETATYLTQLSAHQLTSKLKDLGAKMANAESIGEWYDGAATLEIKSGLFGRAVVLVEGPTESFALPTLLSRLGVEVDRIGVSIIPVGGKGNLAKWYRLFAAYSFRVYVIFDNDRSDDRSAVKRKDLLTTMQVNEEVQESLIEADDMRVGRTLTVFGADYETTMRGLFMDYEGLEEEARELLGGSKPLVARRVAERLDLTVPGPLADLASQIEKLGAYSHSDRSTTNSIAQ